MALSWNDLFLSGSVVDLHVSQWGAKLKIEPADLGIEENQAVSRVLALGHLKLIPHSALKEILEIIGEAKREIEKRSLSFGFIRGARYVPEKNLEKLLVRLKELQASFNESVDKFVKQYNVLMAERIPVIRDALSTASDAATAEEALKRVMAEYPTAELVRTKFSLKWSVYAIKGPSQKALANEGEAVKDVLRNMVVDLREEVAGKLKEVLALTQKGGKIKPRSIESARAVLDRVESVNILGDTTLAEQINQIRVALNRLEGANPTEDTIKSLEEVRGTLEAEIEEAVANAEASLTGVGKRKISMEVQDAV